MDTSSNDSLMILDIDEILKDDSFIQPHSYFEEKTHDDVSNILQQWKNNNNTALTNQQQQQNRKQNKHKKSGSESLSSSPEVDQQMKLQQGLQLAFYDDETAIKLNSKTFTRPRRKSSTHQCNEHLIRQLQHSGIAAALSADNNLTTSTSTTTSIENGANPALNMQIGGLVTTMHKSFLQDTSPPPSICSSSIDASSVERMNNSLITSADFTNISLLQSVQSLNDEERKLVMGINRLNDTNLVLDGDNNGYSLQDMIRDRKALESLTMSGDGTLIKDSQIAQIDDISMTFSKTTSACSTMNNSTESVGPFDNGIADVLNKDQTFHRPNILTVVDVPRERARLAKQKEAVTDVMISDITFNLMECSASEYTNEPSIANDVITMNNDANVKDNRDTYINNETVIVSHASEMDQSKNDTFKKPLPLNETVCYVEKENLTYEDVPMPVEARCETPESKGMIANCMESTPVTTNTHNLPQKQFVPLAQMPFDLTLSPIVPGNILENFEHENRIDSTCEMNQSQSLLMGTFTVENKSRLSTGGKGDIARMNKTFNRSNYLDKEMQNIMNLAEAEARLLAGNDDEKEFEMMLDAISKIQLSPEQVKMKKSLETIKKRFTPQANTLHTSTSSNRKSSVLPISDHITSSPLHSDGLDENVTMTTTPTRHLSDELSNTMKLLKDNSRFAKELSDRNVKTTPKDQTQVRHFQSNSLCNESTKSSDADHTIKKASSSPSANMSNSTRERLLNRRSRLYDNINLSTTPPMGSGTTATPLKSKSSSTSYVISSPMGDNLEHLSASGPPRSLKEDEQKETEAAWKATESLSLSHETNELNFMSSYAMEGDGAESADQSKSEEKLKHICDCDRFKTIKIDRQHKDNDNEIVLDSANQEIQLSIHCIQGSAMANSEMAAMSNNANNIDYDSLKIEIKDDDNNNQDGDKKMYKNYLTYRKPNRPNNLLLPNIGPFDGMENSTEHSSSMAISPSFSQNQQQGDGEEKVRPASPLIVFAKKAPVPIQYSRKSPVAKATQRASPGCSPTQVNKSVPKDIIKPIAIRPRVQVAVDHSAAKPSSSPPQSTIATRKASMESHMMRARNMSGLPKINVGYKASSADCLEQTSSLDHESQLMATQNIRSGSRAIATTSGQISRNQAHAVASLKVSKLKSPMGFKSKSFHNLASNQSHRVENGQSLNATISLAGNKTKYVNCNSKKPMGAAHKSGVKDKQHNNTALKSNIARVDSSRTDNMEKFANVDTLNEKFQQEKPTESVFKVPQPKLASGIRQSANGASSNVVGSNKRTGLLRPSSGYYSLNVLSKGANLVSTNDHEPESVPHRQSTVKSICTSYVQLQPQIQQQQQQPQSTQSQPHPHPQIPMSSENEDDGHELKSSKTFTKIQPAASVTANPIIVGAPKPSGLRPPTTFKRSGLPRPTSIAKR